MKNDSTGTVTCIVLTFNEEINVERCFSSMKWADRIVVVDSGSTDNTVLLAKKHGCDVYYNPWRGFSNQRNWAISNTEIRTDWVLFLDADEEVTQKLRDSIFISISSHRYDAYYLCSKIILFGKWVRRSYNFPVWHLRLFRKNHVKFKNSVTGHGESWEVRGKTGFIEEPYTHYCFSHGLDRWFEKHNRLSSAECQSYMKNRNTAIKYKHIVSKDSHLKRQVLRSISYKLPGRAFIRFIYQMFVRGALLDGVAGWIYCSLYFAYEIMISAKIQEAKYFENRDA
jgi:glycosyltransferase involved in cell wall biosynthesis